MDIICRIASEGQETPGVGSPTSKRGNTQSLWVPHSELKGKSEILLFRAVPAEIKAKPYCGGVLSTYNEGDSVGMVFVGMISYVRCWCFGRG